MWPSGEDLVLLDVETTGLNALTGDRVVEYAAVVVREGIVVDEFQSLVNPHRLMDFRATQANGITDEMLRDQPSFNQVGSQLWNALEGGVMVAHNALFDAKFLVQEFSLAEWGTPNMRIVDTLALSRRNWVARNHKLPTLAEMTGFQGTEFHRAMADVQAMRHIMNSLFSQFRGRYPTVQSLLADAEVNVPIPGTVAPPSQLSNQAAYWSNLATEGKDVQIYYNTPNKPAMWRTIKPLHVMQQSGHEYIVAYCHTRNGERHFRLDRIQDTR